MTKKILAWIVAAAMVLTMMPTITLTASAAKDEHGCGDKADCLVCIVADMINELPEADDIDVNNAAAVVEQIHAIDRIKGDLSEDQYDEMIKLVEAGNDGSGYGVDVPTGYLEAVTAVNDLQAGGSLYIQKKYSVEGEALDWSKTDAIVEIECLDQNSSFEPLNITLADIDIYQNPNANLLKDSYGLEADGWTNKYILPAGTYKITETGYNAVTEDGEKLTTTVTYDVDGEETTNYAIVEVVNGQESAVVLDNSYGPSPSSLSLGVELVDWQGNPLADTVELGLKHNETYEEVLLSGTPAEVSAGTYSFIINMRNESLHYDNSKLEDAELTVSSNGCFLNKEIDGVEITNDPVDGSYIIKITLTQLADVNILVHDEDGNPVSGVGLALCEDGNKIDEWSSTNEKHTVKVANTPLPIYTIEIISCPKEYYCEESSNIIEFSFDEEGKLQTDAAIKDGNIVVTINKDDEYFIGVIEEEREIKYGDPIGDIWDQYGVTRNGEKVYWPFAGAGKVFETTCTDKNGDTKIVDIKTVLPPGEYTITGEWCAEMPEDRNYTFGEMELTVAKRTLDVDDFTVSVKEKEYDGSPEVELEASAKYKDSVLYKDVYAGKVTVEITGKFESSEVGENKPVSYVILLSGDGASNYDFPEDGITGTTTGNINAKTIDKEISLSLDVPAVGEDFDEEVSGVPNGVDVKLSWQKGDEEVSGKAKYNTTYTATVELTPKENYVFADKTEVKINGDPVETSVSDNKLIASKTFKTQKAKLSGIIAPKTIIKSNRTSVEDLINAMPEEVTLKTEDGEKTGVVEWATEEFDTKYDIDELNEQIFAITGTVTVPSDIDPDGAVLETEQNFIIESAPTVEDLSIEVTEGTAGAEGYTTDVTVKITTETAGAEIYYTVDGSDPKSGEKYDGPITLKGEEGKDVTRTIKAIAVKDGMFDSKATDETIKITIPVEYPTAEISVKNSTWTQLLNTITFKKFFKEIQDVTIDAADSYSDIGSIEYCISDRELTETEIENARVAWAEYNGGFSIAPNSKNIIYAKVTDGVGNITIINTDGIILYTDSSVVKTDYEYIQEINMKTTEVEVDFQNNTVDTIKAEGDELTPDKDYTVNYDEETITFSEECLDSLDAGNHLITVSYNPMGEKYNADDDENQAPAETTLSLKIIDTKKNEDGSTTADRDEDGEFGTEGDEYYIPTGDEDDPYTEVKPNEDGSYTDENGTPDDPSDDTTYIPDQDGDGKAEPDTDGDGIYEGTADDKTYIPDQDGDSKPEPDTNGDNIYEGTKGEKDYIPDQDGDNKPEVDDDNDQIFDNEKDDKHYVPDGNGGFIEYFFTYEVSDDVLTWTLGGTENLTYTVDGPIEKFNGLKLDGTAVDEDDYSYVSGSTIITLKASYLNSLSVGEYPLVADYADGTGETTLKVVAAAIPGDGENTEGGITSGNNEDDATDTGDDADPLLWFMIMMAAAGAAVVTRKIKA